MNPNSNSILDPPASGAIINYNFLLIPSNVLELQCTPLQKAFLSFLSYKTFLGKRWYGGRNKEIADGLGVVEMSVKRLLSWASISKYVQVTKASGPASRRIDFMLLPDTESNLVLKVDGRFVVYHKLTWDAKFILSMIAYHDEGEGCPWNNTQLASALRMNPGNLRKNLSVLKSRGWLESNLVGLSLVSFPVIENKGGSEQFGTNSNSSEQIVTGGTNSNEFGTNSNSPSVLYKNKKEVSKKIRKGATTDSSPTLDLFPDLPRRVPASAPPGRAETVKRERLMQIKGVLKEEFPGIRIPRAPQRDKAIWKFHKETEMSVEVIRKLCATIKASGYLMRTGKIKASASLQWSWVFGYPYGETAERNGGQMRAFDILAGKYSDESMGVVLEIKANEGKNIVCGQIGGQGDKLFAIDLNEVLHCPGNGSFDGKERFKRTEDTHYSGSGLYTDRARYLGQKQRLPLPPLWNDYRNGKNRLAETSKKAFIKSTK